MRNILALFTACLVAAGSLHSLNAQGAAPAPTVRDHAGLFSPAAVRQADDAIRNIRREFQKDLLVETFAGVPEGRTADYTQNREQFFADFVRERAQASRVDGIYVLMMKEQPPHRLRIQVGIGQATRQRAFTPTDRDELVRRLQSDFRAEQYDDGLRKAVGFVDTRLRSNLQGASAANRGAPGMSLERGAPVKHSGSRSPMGSLLTVALLIGGGILVFSLLMRLLRGGANTGGGLAGAGGMRSGGGFFSSLLGGLGGAIAGSWLYDRFLGGNAQASEHPTYSDTPPSDVGGDYSSSGGDIDAGSGGDFGGGGGDAGGGDFGGGGDV